MNFSNAISNVKIALVLKISSMAVKAYDGIGGMDNPSNFRITHEVAA